MHYFFTRVGVMHVLGYCTRTISDLFWVHIGPFMMGSDAMMAGAALADLARKFQTRANGFGGPNIDMAQQIPLFVDMQEDEQQYILTADVPGLQKSDLKVNCCRHHLLNADTGLQTFLRDLL